LYHDIKGNNNFYALMEDVDDEDANKTDVEMKMMKIVSIY